MVAGAKSALIVSAVFVWGAPFASGDHGDVDFPYNRYKLWSQLTSTQRTHARTIGYTSVRLWNRVGTMSKEAFSYGNVDEFTDTQRDSIKALFNEFGTGVSNGVQYDLVEPIWDCYVNHYDDYSWAEMQTEGVAVHWEGLGWDQAMWDNGTGAPPPSDDLGFAELGDMQPHAIALCYFEETWDGVPVSMADWQNLPSSDPPTVSPTTASPTQSPTQSPTTGSPTQSPTTASPTAPCVQPFEFCTVGGDPCCDDKDGNDHTCFPIVEGANPFYVCWRTNSLPQNAPGGEPAGGKESTEKFECAEGRARAEKNPNCDRFLREMKKYRKHQRQRRYMGVRGRSN